MTLSPSKIILLLLLTQCRCFPVQQYNPNRNYGGVDSHYHYDHELIGVIEELEPDGESDYNDEMYSMPASSRGGSRDSPVISSRRKLALPPTDLDGKESGVQLLDYSPEFLRLLQSYIMLKQFEAIHMSGKGDSKNYYHHIEQHRAQFSQTPAPGFYRKRDNGLPPSEVQKPVPSASPPISPKEEIEDYSDEDNVDFSSNRRTFGLLMPVIETGIKMIDQDLGLGLVDSANTVDNQQYIQQVKTKAQLDALREAKQQAQLDQLKMEASLQQLRKESADVSRENKAELDLIKSKLDKAALDTERERREKEELRLRLERESSLRNRENQELKSKLELEASLREKDRFRMQSELLHQNAQREKEKLELKNKLELSMMEQENKKILDETKSKMEAKISSQYIIHDYRAPIMGSSPVYPPTLSAGPTVGFL